MNIDCHLLTTLVETLPRNDKGPCNITSGGSDVDCVESVIEEMSSKQRRCMCNLECNEIDYKLMISQSVWPSKQYEVLSWLRNIQGKCLRIIFLSFAERGNESIWLCFRRYWGEEYDKEPVKSSSIFHIPQCSGSNWGSQIWGTPIWYFMKVN